MNVNSATLINMFNCNHQGTAGNQKELGHIFQDGGFHSRMTIQTLKRSQMNETVRDAMVTRGTGYVPLCQACLVSKPPVPVLFPGSPWKDGRSAGFP